MNLCLHQTEFLYLTSHIINSNVVVQMQTNKRRGVKNKLINEK